MWLVIFLPVDDSLAAWVDSQVSATNDDAEEQAPAGSMYRNSTDLELVDDGSTAQIVGMRFNDLTVPQGATILQAYIEFETDSTDSGATSLTIKGEAVDDAVTFGSSANDISDRPTTTQSVAWSPGPWTTTSERHKTPDLSGIVQEIVNRAGWSSGNSMVIVVSGSGVRTAESYDGEAANAPILRIEYEGDQNESTPICYAVADGGDILISIDLTNNDGDGNSIGPVGVPDIEAMAIEPRDYVLYAADADQLGRINRTTGAFTRLTAEFGTGDGDKDGTDTPVVFDDVDGLAFDIGIVTSVLYGVQADVDDDVLLQIAYKDAAGSPEPGAHLPGVFGALSLNDRPNSSGQPSAEREMNLVGNTTATFTFDYRTVGTIEASDRVVVEVSDNGGGSWTTLVTYSDDVSGSASFDISGSIATNTRIRFRVSNNYGGQGERFEVDNVQIWATDGSSNQIFLDRFDTAAFDNNDGNATWATDWDESGDDGDPTSGRIYVRLDDYRQITGAASDIDDIAVDPTDGQMYAVGSGGGLLYSLNKYTGVATTIGNIGTGSLDVEGIGFDATGQLYGISTSGAARFFEIDKSDGSTTEVDDNSNDLGPGVGTDHEAVDCAFLLGSRAQIGNVVAYTSPIVGTIVRWETLSESGTVAFFVTRESPSGKRARREVPVNKRALPALYASRTGGTYHLVDRKAKPGKRYRYRIYELEADGKRLEHGPFDIKVLATAPVGAPLEVAKYRDDEKFEASLRILDQMQWKRWRADRRKSKRRSRAHRAAQRGTTLNLLTKEAGLHYVSAQTIAEKLETSPEYVRRLIKRRQLALTNQGRSVAVLPGGKGAGLYFYAKKLRNPRIANNVYQLRKGTAVSMQTRRVRGGAMVHGRWYQASAEANVDLYPVTHLFDDPYGDYFMWDWRFEDNPPPNVDVFPLETPSVDGNADTNAILTVRLVGASTTDHGARVSLNGYEIGTVRFDGLGEHEARFAVAPDLLLDGTNAIEIDGLGSGMEKFPSVFYVNSLSVEYPSYYIASSGALEAGTNSYRRLTVEGFESKGPLLLDITNPTHPVQLTGFSSDRRGGSYAITFGPRKSQRFLAVDYAAAHAPVEIVAYTSSGLRARNNKADWLVITQTHMRDGVRPLAKHRQEQGWLTKVVTMDAVYNEFSSGLEDPSALQSFLKFAHDDWTRPPLFVLLAGKGSIDFADRLEYGGSIVPTLLMSTANGLVSADSKLSDVDNDGLPDMMLGRLPVRNSDELSDVSNKIIQYETSEASADEWEYSALFAWDGEDGAGDFSAAVEDSMTFVPTWYDVIRIDNSSRSNEGSGEAPSNEQSVTEVLNEGVAYVAFHGHGNYRSMGKGGGILDVDDVQSLQNRNRLPVVGGFTCQMGETSQPGIQSLGEALMVEGGGAVAVLGLSGYSESNLSSILSSAFYYSTFQDGEMILGSAVRDARKHYVDRKFHKNYHFRMNLLGDPATQMK